MELEDKMKEISRLGEKLERIESFYKDIFDNDYFSGMSCHLFYQTKITKKINILNRFSFHSNTREESISIPNDLNMPIKILVKQEIDATREELRLIIDGTGDRKEI